MKLDISINSVGKFARTFIFANVLLSAGWGFITPIFAIFIVEKIAGATLITVGTLAAIYWIVKSLIQIPIANFLDKTDGERDDFYILVGAFCLSGVAAFLFTQVSEIWHLYLLQIIHATAFGFYVPAWTGMFSRHMDRKHESLDWSFNSTGIGLASGLTGLIGGVIASWAGFNTVFILAALFSFSAAVVIVIAPDIVFPKKIPASEIFIKEQ